MPLREPDSHGFALLEVIIAAGLVVGIAAGASQIVALAMRQREIARARTFQTVLAAEKMEQLRSLAWTHVTVGVPPLSFPLSDVTTDVSRSPAAEGGPGLLPSPAGTIDRNTPPYVDYLDAAAQWVGNADVPPPSAVYVRRWAVVPLPGDPDNVRVLHVVVAMRGRERETARSTHLVTVMARR